MTLTRSFIVGASARNERRTRATSPGAGTTLYIVTFSPSSTMRLYSFSRVPDGLPQFLNSNAFEYSKEENLEGRKSSAPSRSFPESFQADERIYVNFLVVGKIFLAFRNFEF